MGTVVDLPTTPETPSELDTLIDQGRLLSQKKLRRMKSSPNMRTDYLAREKLQDREQPIVDEISDVLVELTDLYDHVKAIVNNESFKDLLVLQASEQGVYNSWTGESPVSHAKRLGQLFRDASSMAEGMAVEERSFLKDDREKLKRAHRDSLALLVQELELSHPSDESFETGNIEKILYETEKGIKRMAKAMAQCP